MLISLSPFSWWQISSQLSHSSDLLSSAHHRQLGRPRTVRRNWRIVNYLCWHTSRMEHELRCNNLSCRALLSSTGHTESNAIVTTCSRTYTAGTEGKATRADQLYSCTPINHCSSTDIFCGRPALRINTAARRSGPDHVTCIDVSLASQSLVPKQSLQTHACVQHVKLHFLTRAPLFVQTLPFP